MRRAREAVDYADRNVKLFERRADAKRELRRIEARRLSDDAGDGERRAHARDRRLAKRALDDITREIIELNRGLVRSYVRRFTSAASRCEVEDYEAAGLVGLMTAIESYDPSKGKFASWSYKPIQREVLRSVGTMEFTNMTHSDFEARPAILKARMLLGADRPDDGIGYDEIAAKAGVSVGQVIRVLDAPRIDTLTSPLSDFLEDSAPSVEDAVVSRMGLDALERYGLPSLDDRERLVLTRRFGLDGEPEQRLTDIGKGLGLSRESVRQIEAKAISKMSHPVTLRHLAALA